jgi:DNA-binding LacI/PurR family transcriptional regulator
VATKGTRILLDLLKGGAPEPSQIVFEPELIIRSSTAPPRQASEEHTQEVAMA